MDLNIPAFGSGVAPLASAFWVLHLWLPPFWVPHLGARTLASAFWIPHLWVPHLWVPRFEFRTFRSLVLEIIIEEN